MMLSRGYTFFSQGDLLRLVWESPSLPRGWLWASVALLGVLPVLWVYRVSVARFCARHLHLPMTARAIGIGAPLLSLACGFALLYARPSVPLIEWRFDQQGVVLKGTGKQVAMKWKDVASAEFDPRTDEEPALVLKSKDGREAWIILSWLEPAHQAQVLKRIQKATGLPKTSKRTTSTN